MRQRLAKAGPRTTPALETYRMMRTAYERSLVAAAPEEIPACCRKWWNAMGRVEEFLTDEEQATLEAERRERSMRKPDPDCYVRKLSQEQLSAFASFLCDRSQHEGEDHAAS